MKCNIITLYAHKIYSVQISLIADILRINSVSITNYTTLIARLLRAHYKIL